MLYLLNEAPARSRSSGILHRLEELSWPENYSCCHTETSLSYGRIYSLYCNIVFSVFSGLYFITILFHSTFSINHYLSWRLWTVNLIAYYHLIFYGRSVTNNVRFDQLKQTEKQNDIYYILNEKLSDNILSRNPHK